MKANLIQNFLMPLVFGSALTLTGCYTQIALVEDEPEASPNTPNGSIVLPPPNGYCPLPIFQPQHHENTNQPAAGATIAPSTPSQEQTRSSGYERSSGSNQSSGQPSSNSTTRTTGTRR